MIKFLLLFIPILVFPKNIQIYRYSIVHSSKTESHITCIWYDHKIKEYIGKPDNVMQMIAFDTNIIKQELNHIVFQSALTNKIQKTLSTTYQRKDWHFSSQKIRSQVLETENLLPTIYRSSNLDGIWYDHYTGQYFMDKKLLQIDHMIPLAHAHVSGGDQWSHHQKQRFASNLDSPAMLIGVYSKANQSKNNKSLYNYIPPNPKFRKIYIQIWLDLKKEYLLLLSPYESKLLTTELS